MPLSPARGLGFVPLDVLTTSAVLGDYFSQMATSRQQRRFGFPGAKTGEALKHQQAAVAVWQQRLTPTRSIGSRSAGDFGSGRDPQGVRLVALAVQLEHGVDQIVHRVALVRDGGEVAEVLLAGLEILR